MNDLDFKLTLIKALEHNANTQSAFNTEGIWKIISSLPLCNLYIEDTCIYTRIEWNTYCSILHIQVPLDTRDTFVANSKLVLDVAQQLFGRQADQYLTDIDIGILVEHYEIIDFSEISLTQVISKAINDAELLMQQGKYDSAFDRIHTAFHGYLRKVLDNRNVSYEESDTLNQLYNKLHSDICNKITPGPMADLIKTTLRSGSGIISSMNDKRNRHSLSHPNSELISNREAKFVIQLVKAISSYINEVI